MPYLTSCLYTHRSDNRQSWFRRLFFLLQMQWLNCFLVVGPAPCSHLSSDGTAAGFAISPFCLANWIAALLACPRHGVRSVVLSSFSVTTQGSGFWITAMTNRWDTYRNNTNDLVFFFFGDLKDYLRALAKTSVWASMPWAMYAHSWQMFSGCS